MKFAKKAPKRETLVTCIMLKKWNVMGADRMVHEVVKDVPEKLAKILEDNGKLKVGEPMAKSE